MKPAVDKLYLTKEAAKILSDVLGRKISYVDISENDFREEMKVIGMDEVIYQLNS